MAQKRGVFRTKARLERKVDRVLVLNDEAQTVHTLSQHVSKTLIPKAKRLRYSVFTFRTCAVPRQLMMRGQARSGGVQRCLNISRSAETRPFV
jgi:hypothetical protein